MNKGGSGEADSHPKAGSDIRSVMLGSSCFESCRTKKKKKKEGGQERTEGRGCGKGGKKKANLIKVVAYSGMFNSKHVRLKATDVSTACSLTSVVNIC